MSHSTVIPLAHRMSPADVARNALHVPDLTPSERIVLFHLAFLQETTDQHARIAADIHLSRRSVLSALSVLEERGYIERQYVGGQSRPGKTQRIRTAPGTIMRDAAPGEIRPERKTPRKHISPSKALEVFARDDYRCRECGTREDLSVDHILPVLLGGTNDMDNLQTLCRSCNSRKGATYTEGN